MLIPRDDSVPNEGVDESTPTANKPPRRSRKSIGEVLDHGTDEEKLELAKKLAQATPLPDWAKLAGVGGTASSLADAIAAVGIGGETNKAISTAAGSMLEAFQPKVNLLAQVTLLAKSIPGANTGMLGIYAADTLKVTNSMASAIESWLANSPTMKQLYWPSPTYRPAALPYTPPSREATNRDVQELRNEVAELRRELHSYHEKDQEQRQRIAETHLGVQRMARGYEPGTAPLFGPDEDEA